MVVKIRLNNELERYKYKKVTQQKGFLPVELLDKKTKKKRTKRKSAEIFAHHNLPIIARFCYEYY